MDTGKVRMIPPGGSVKGVNKTRYNDPAAKAYRAALGGGPIRDNPQVPRESKGMRNAARMGSK